MIMPVPGGLLVSYKGLDAEVVSVLCRGQRLQAHDCPRGRSVLCVKCAHLEIAGNKDLRCHCARCVEFRALASVDADEIYGYAARVGETLAVHPFEGSVTVTE